ncbi:hypothetical protein [Laceyella sacchari]|uniref:Uncharacterized protein n=1 Tax=Laceyella sacchari TaxID=37482 RepID=A0ABY5U484_LACSH|nr:hypothetical protein [Laceyella sacchari]UWE03390.1 hypothetical protein NYR52_14965 [Laceyella sacchari]
MLIEKMDLSIRLIQDVVEVKKNEKKIKDQLQFSSIVKKEIPNKIAALQSIYLLKKKEGFPSFNISVSSVLHKVEQLLEVMEKQPGKEKIERIIRELQEIEDEGKKQWANYVRKQNEGILNVLLLLQKVAPDDESLSHLIVYFQRSTKIWPLTSAKLEQYENKLKQGKQKLSEWKTNETIHAFLEKVSNNEATLDDLNDEVLNWLRVHQLSSNLMIKIK